MIFFAYYNIKYNKQAMNCMNERTNERTKPM